MISRFRKKTVGSFRDGQAECTGERRSNRADRVTLFNRFLSGKNTKATEKTEVNPAPGIHKTRVLKTTNGISKVSRFRRDEKAAMGVGTLTIFIAMVVIAAIAAGVMLYAGQQMKDSTNQALEGSTNSITKGLTIVSIIGDRNENGNDSTVLRASFPKKDPWDPLPGVLESVEVTPDGVSPLRMTLTWTSGEDLDTELKEERIYRSSAVTLNSSLDAISSLNKVLDTAELLVTIPYDENERDRKTYVDYTISDTLSLYYAYAVVGLDRADNEILYSSLNRYNRTDNTTIDEDSTAPDGNLYDVDYIGGTGQVYIQWTITNTTIGAPLSKQYVYRNDSSMANAEIFIDSNGRTKVGIHGSNILIAELDGFMVEYDDFPSEAGTYHYAVIGEDASGNQGFYTVYNGVAVGWVDKITPTGVFNLFYFKNPNSIKLSWGPAIDQNSGISGYNVYRERDIHDMDTLAKVKHLKPLARLDENTNEFEDFNGSSSVYYYYLVTSVDRAGNMAKPTMPTDRLQILEFKVRVQPGSDSIRIRELSFGINDGDTDVTLRYGTESENDTYTAVAVMDPGEIFLNDEIITKGNMVKIMVNLADVGLALTLDKEVEIKIIHSEAIITFHTFEVPAMLSDRYVLIW